MWVLMDDNPARICPVLDWFATKNLSGRTGSPLALVTPSPPSPPALITSTAPLRHSDAEDARVMAPERQGGSSCGGPRGPLDGGKRLHGPTVRDASLMR